MKKTQLPQDILQFLDKNHFFDFQNFSEYYPLLDSQIAARLEFDNPLNLAVPLSASPNVPLSQNFLVMDLGGTYLRIYLCQSKETKTIVLAEHKISFYQDKIYTDEILVNDLTEAIKDFHRKHIEEMEKTPWSQIVFSFGNALQPAIKSNNIDGKILYWGKAHRQRGLLGTWLGSSLQDNLTENGYPDCRVQLINDGTLSVLAGYLESQSQDALASLIVGTGTNLNVGFKQDSDLHLVNLEFGDFEFAPYSNFDEQLNVRVSTPNHFRTEKMFSGAWQNQLFQIILEFAKKDKFIKSEGLIEKISQYSSGDLEMLFMEGPDKAKTIGMSENDWKTCRIIWDQLTARGAALCALAVSRLAVQLKLHGYLQGRLVLIPSGALLEHSHPFQKDFQKSLQLFINTFPELTGQDIISLEYQNIACQSAGALLSLLPH